MSTNKKCHLKMLITPPVRSEYTQTNDMCKKDLFISPTFLLPYPNDKGLPKLIYGSQLTPPMLFEEIGQNLGSSLPRVATRTSVLTRIARITKAQIGFL
jgi:hypothetical protein